jgi:hypothetical protein
MIVYVFYTLAATKMTSFGVIVSPFIFLGFGALVHVVFTILPVKKWLGVCIQTGCLLIICFMMTNTAKVAEIHVKTPRNITADNNLREMKLIHTLKKTLKDEKYVVFNARITYRGNIPVMFYTSYVAYDFVPTVEQINTVRKKGYKTAVIDLGDLPMEICDEEMVVVKP